MRDYQWDLFICHASEDKDKFVRPLAEALRLLSLRVWYDEFTLSIGDSLSQSIDRGLLKSRYGMVVITPNFFMKKFPQHELRGLIMRHIDEDKKVILPIWHGVTKKEVCEFSSTLSDLAAITTEKTSVEDIPAKILLVVRPDIHAQYEQSDLLKLYKCKPLHELHGEIVRLRQELDDFKCPHCGALMEQHNQFSTDEFDVDTKIFECGFETDGGHVQKLCPHAADIPAFEEFEIEYEENRRLGWYATGKPKTVKAMPFGTIRPLFQSGLTKKEAFERLFQAYSDWKLALF